MTDHGAPSPTAPAVGLCNHCGLPLKAGSMRATVAGVVQNFCCYGCMLCQKIMGSPDEGGQYGWTLAKMSLGWLLGGPVMGLSGADYLGAFDGASQSDQWMVAWIVFGLATAIFFLLGLPYLWSGLVSAIRGKITADVLIAIGYASAYGFSTYSILTATDIAAARAQMYFDSGSMIIVLVSLGKFVEAAARRRTSQSLRELSAVHMGEAIRLSPTNAEERGPASSLRIGDRIRVMPGATVPADGRVESGESGISEALLTGESTPVSKRPGSSVLAGTVNGESPLVVIVEAVGEACVSARVVTLAREALARRSPTELAVDRVAQFFVPAIIITAGVAGWLGYLAASEAAAASPVIAGIQRALSVLVVSCPCALGLATPLAIAIAISRGAEMGLFFRSGDAVEGLATVKRMYLDKTGTLTTGKFGVTAFTPASAEENPAALEATAAALASASEHWLSAAIAAHGRERGLEAVPVESPRSRAGMGVEGVIGGHRHWLGSREMAGMLPMPSGIEAAAAAATERGDALVFFGNHAGVLGLFTLSDSLKPDAARAVSGLKTLEIEPVLVTGDNQSRAAAAAKELGISTVHAGVRPEGKLAIIEADANPRQAGMTGDGVNDGPALMRAGVGISFSEATGLARIAAGLTLAGGSLRKLTTAIVLARKTRRIVYGNLAWAFGYNIVAIGFAVSGHLSAVMAAFAMLGSSTFVVRNSWRLYRFGER